MSGIVIQGIFYIYIIVLLFSIYQINLFISNIIILNQLNHYFNNVTYESIQFVLK
jgi:hypothetical protein